MKRVSSKTFSILAVSILMIATSSCQKEEVALLPKKEEPLAPNLIFIRAIEKDGSITNSAQIPLK